MNRLINQIYKAIEDNADIFHQLNIEAPETVDIHFGQPSDPEHFEFTLPAVFIDYDINYATGHTNIMLHCLYEFGADTESFSSTPNGDKYIIYLKALRRIITGVNLGKIFSQLQPAQELPIITDAYHYHQLSFTCKYNQGLDPELDPYIKTPFNVQT